MLPLVLLLTVVINLAAYSYLDIYHHAGLHPAPGGFRASSSLSSIFRTVSLVWAFGGVSGFFVAMLALFDVLTYSFFWVFMIPAAVNIIKVGDASTINPIPAWAWQITVIAVPLLLAVCFFTQPYAPLNAYLHSWWQWGTFVMVIAFGFVCRLVFAHLYDARH